MKSIKPKVTASLKVFLPVLASFLALPSFTQQSYTYRFSDTPFISVPPGGPNLEPIGPMTTPVTVIIPTSTCIDMPAIDLTYFQKNSGFKAKSFFTGTYSIEMIFKFDELESYNRIIDFSNSNSDHGIYTLYDCLNFFPSGNIGACPGAFDTVNYKQIVITRHEVSKEMNVYVNGSLFTNYIDATDNYVIGAAPNDSIKFFKDDIHVTNEASPGHVALIQMCDFVLSPLDVVTSYNNFCERITRTHELKSNIDVKLYPIPANDRLTIQITNVNFSKEIILTIVNTFGRQIAQIPIYDELTHIELGHMPAGVQFYQLQIDHSVVKSGKILLR